MAGPLCDPSWLIVGSSIDRFTGTGAASILTFENGTNAIISAKSFVFILFVVFKVNIKISTAKLEPLKTTDKFSDSYLYTVLHKSDTTNVKAPMNRGLLRG